MINLINETWAWKANTIKKKFDGFPLEFLAKMLFTQHRVNPKYSDMLLSDLGKKL